MVHPLRGRTHAVSHVGWLVVSVLALAVCGRGPRGRPEDAPAEPVPPQETSGSSSQTRTQMRNLDLVIAEGVRLRVRYLNGWSVRVRPDTPVILDDKNSFLIEVDDAETFVDYESLSRLMNEYVFAFEGAPIRDLEITQEEDEDQRDLVELNGHLTSALGTPFEIEGRPEVTPDGDLRIRTTDIQAFDIEVEGLLDLLGLEAEDMIPSLEERGVRVEGDNVVLVLDRLMPPPRMSGRASEVQVLSSGLLIRLGNHGSGGSIDEGGGNYLYYRGGTIRIGKMTMHDADLRILDEKPDDPFDFSVDRLNEQLQAGYAKLQPDGGLIMHVPDLGTIADSAR